MYRWLADGLVLVHVGFILFVIFGGLLLWRSPRVIWVHLPCVARAILISLFGWLCPLTPLDQTLRNWAGHNGYDGSFIDQYLLPFVYPSGC